MRRRPPAPACSPRSSSCSRRRRTRRQARRRRHRRRPRRRGPLHDRPDRARRRARARRAVPRTPPPAVEQALARVAGGARAPEVSRSELVLPLAARDVRFGALELGLNGSPRRFGAEDRALAEELARRCAAALDNARLVAEARSRRERAARGLRAARRDLRARAGRPRGPRPRPALRAHQRPHGRDQRPDGRRAHRAHGRRDRARGGGRRGRPAPGARERRAADRGRGRGHDRGRAGRRPRVDRLLLAGAPPRRPPRRRRRRGRVRGHRAARRRARGARADGALRVAAGSPCRRSGRRWSWRTPTAGSSTRTPPSRRSAATAPRSSRRCRRSSTSSSTSSARAPASGRGMRFAGRSGPGNQLTIRHRDGHRIPMEVAGVPLDVGGRRQMVVVARDVTARARAEAERERLLHRAAFLAEASAAFDEVLDEEATLDRARPALRPRARRHLRDPARRLRRRDPPRGDRRARPGGRGATCASWWSATRSPTAARTRCSRSSPAARRASSSIPTAPTSRVEDERHRELVARFATQSTLLVPLTARGRSLGVMALGFNTLVGRRPPLAVRGRRPARRAGDRQRAALRGAREGRTHAPALAAAAGAAARPGRPAGGALPRRRRGQRGRRRLLRLLPDRRRRLGARDRRRLRQGRRGRRRHRARPLHGARVGHAALRPAAGRAGGPQRGDPPRGRRRQPLLHGALHLAQAAARRASRPASPPAATRCRS